MQLTGRLGRLGIAALAGATLAGGWLVATPSVHAQGPATVPVARFYGTARDAAGQPPVGYTVAATIGGNSCGSSQTITGGVSTTSVDNTGNYVFDVQAVPGCTTPGATVVFTAGALRAKETGTIPDLPGTAVHLNLTFQSPATPTAAPPPPPSATPRPATPAPPPPSTATAAPRPPVTPVVQAPKGPVRVQGPAGGGVAQAPRLPNTGTGGLLDQSSSSPAGWALVLVVVAAIGVSASGIFAYKRSGR